MPDYGMVSSIGSAIGGVYAANANANVARHQSEANNFIRAQNNTAIDAENRRDAVLTGIQRWKQTIYNKRVMANAASDQEMLAVNYARQRDARARGSFSDQIRSAEEAGRMQAQAAMSGVSGSVVDVLNATLAMRKGMQDTQTATAGRQADYDEMRKEGSVWLANLDKLDNTLILDNPRGHDYGFDPTPPANVLASLNVKDVKNIAQGGAEAYAKFSFSTPAPYSLDSFFKGTGTSGD